MSYLKSSRYPSGRKPPEPEQLNALDSPEFDTKNNVGLRMKIGRRINSWARGSAPPLRGSVVVILKNLDGVLVNRKPKISRVAILVVVYGLCLAPPAFAYVDPNATNLLTQILTPLLVIAAAGVTFLRKQTVSAFGWLADRVLRRKK
jgi:hypothetical protein